jgi:hypothetical protein
MLSRKLILMPSCGLMAGIVLVFMTTFISSCTNPEGQGGTGSVSGRITEYFYNDDYSQLLYTQGAADEDVYIIYGDDNVPGDRIRTGLSGDFRFEYLYPGNYSVYYSSEDSARVPDDGWIEPITVSIGHGEDKDLGELVKISSLNYDDGSATISGVVKEIKYVNGSVWPNLVVEYVDFAYEKEIYLTYGNHQFYDERVRTQDNGYFEFRNLIPGDYRIFLYSEDVTRQVDLVVLEFHVTITDIAGSYSLGEISVENI